MDKVRELEGKVDALCILDFKVNVSFNFLDSCTKILQERLQGRQRPQSHQATRRRDTRMDSTTTEAVSDDDDL